MAVFHLHIYTFSNLLLSSRLFLGRVTEIYLSAGEFFRSYDGGLRHLLVMRGNLDLLAILENLLEAISAGSKFGQLILQLFLLQSRKLVGTLGDDHNRLINVMCHVFNLPQVAGNYF